MTGSKIYVLYYLLSVNIRQNLSYIALIVFSAIIIVIASILILTDIIINHFLLNSSNVC